MLIDKILVSYATALRVRCASGYKKCGWSKLRMELVL